MQLHEFHITRKKRRVRIGRGGKRGTYSGRGLKGQKSRAGRVIRPALRDLISRLPKKWGVTNKPHTSRPWAVNVRALAKLNGEITVERLKKEGFVPSRHKGGVKLIGSQKIPNPLTVKGIKVSKGVRAIIEKAGGTVITNNANRGGNNANNPAHIISKN
jgi:large subunit ribosomal protein L15